MEKNTYNTAKEILINTPIPPQTRTYKPVSHRQLIDLTLNSIHDAGFSLDRELYSASSNGEIANGKFTISNVRDKDMQLQIGWQNSYNKQLTLKFAIGTKIFICQNGMVSGDHGAFKKKHVGEIQTFTPSAITEYIKSSGEIFQKMQEQRDTMKNVEISKRVQAELIGRMLVEEEFIESTQLNIINRELKKPTHDYGAENSMWELYNFTTFAMKEVHPRFWMENHIKAHTFFVNEAGALIGSKNTPVIDVYSGLDRRQLELI